MDIQELRKQCKALGINSFAKSKEQLEQLLAEKQRYTGVNEKAEIPVIVTGNQTVDEEARKIREMRRERGKYERDSRPLNLVLRHREDGYEYRFVVDRPSRIAHMRSRGWEVDPKNEPLSAGKNTEERHVVMKIPSSIYEEDQLAKREARLKQEEALKRGESSAGKIEDNRRYGTATIEQRA